MRDRVKGENNEKSSCAFEKTFVFSVHVLRFSLSFSCSFFVADLPDLKILLFHELNMLYSSFTSFASLEIKPKTASFSYVTVSFFSLCILSILYICICTSLAISRKYR